MGASNIGSGKYPLAKIPAMADPADIHVALKYYHWGQATEPDAEANADAGIAHYLDAIDDRIEDIEIDLANVIEDTVIDAKGDLIIGVLTGTASVTNKVLTGNVATLTTSAAHEFIEGDKIIVTDVGATFDGTYIVTATTNTTVSYAKTASNVASAAVSPVGQVQQVSVDNLTVGSDGHVLTADSTVDTFGLKWSAPTVSTSQITGSTTGTGSLVFGTTPTLSRSFLVSPREKVTISATAAGSDTHHFDVITQSVLYYTSNASGNFTLNIRGDGSTTLDSLLNTGDALTAVFLVTNGATAYYHSTLTIDGNSITPKWQGGTAPSSGNPSSIDSYSYTVIKTGSAAFTVLASQTRFA